MRIFFPVNLSFMEVSTAAAHLGNRLALTHEQLYEIAALAVLPFGMQFAHGLKGLTVVEQRYHLVVFGIVTQSSDVIGFFSETFVLFFA